MQGRYAPSPTGELHLGNASTAWIAWLSARAQQGRYLMRIEDLDRARSREAYAAQCLEDLSWFGIDWDGEVVVQSTRQALYDDAFEKLRREDRLYPCFCRRKDIAAAAGAPQEPGEMRRYPGICRELTREQRERKIRDGERHAWRFRVEEERSPTFNDLVFGNYGSDATPPGDFVVRRADGVSAYQLAVVVDDAAMGVDEVVRGADLLESTAAQLLLYDALGLPAPRFGHVPLLLGTDGARLSKRHQGVTLRELREAGWSAAELRERLQQILGVDPEAFDWSQIEPNERGYRVDPGEWR